MPKAFESASGERPAALPLLASGDSLDASEYWTRYQATPGVRAERIQGTVFLMAGPVSASGHGQPHALLAGWLAQYAAGHADTRLFIDTTVRLDPDNDPQPDLCLCRFPGSSRLIDGFLHGPPELVVEIAGSSASYDLTTKRDIYARAGVREYMVYEPFDQHIHWWHASATGYEPLSVVDSILHSRVYSGLKLNIAALRAANLHALMGNA